MPEAVAVAVNALPAGVEPVSSASSKFTVSLPPFTDAPTNSGGLTSSGRMF